MNKFVNSILVFPPCSPPLPLKFSLKKKKKKKKKGIRRRSKDWQKLETLILREHNGIPQK
jgi:hypothetical protein